MKFALLFFVFILFLIGCSSDNKENNKSSLSESTDLKSDSIQPIAIVIHGGAGTILKENLSDSLEAAYLTLLDSLISSGFERLENGEIGMDVVESIINFMEDSPLFNAGRGAVFTANGENELDASIMHGRERNAGAVAGVKRVQYPISLARKVMENSDHVLLMGSGAEEFAASNGVVLIDPSYFYVESRYQSLLRVQEKEALNKNTQKEKYGTVGCVVLDAYGDIVAGTSTGGMTNKKWGRVGDSPIIGAGTFADNSSVGVSATGWGEYFIRYSVAYDIAALFLYKGLSLQAACDEVIHQKLAPIGGDGGVVALDKHGKVSLTFNSKGMYRAAKNNNGVKIVAIFE